MAVTYLRLYAWTDWPEAKESFNTDYQFQDRELNFGQNKPTTWQEYDYYNMFVIVEAQMGYFFQCNT
jgi:hypothetical protein